MAHLVKDFNQIVTAVYIAGTCICQNLIYCKVSQQSIFPAFKAVKASKLH